MAIDIFRGVVPFVAVAEEKSFRRAAALLGVSAAAVSKAVQALEADLGTTLFERTNRVVALTRQGELLFERCRPAVASVEGARAAVLAAKREPRGELAVAAPLGVMPLLLPALSLLRSRFAGLGFRVKVSEARSRAAEGAADVAVRLGGPARPSPAARRLRRTRLCTVASPVYLARRGTPARVEHLSAHDCVVLAGPRGAPEPWRFATGRAAVAGTVTLDHGAALVDAAVAGLGVTQALDFLVQDHLKAGRLVELLAAFAAEGPEVHAVCAPGRRPSANVWAAFQALVDAFGPED